MKVIATDQFKKLGVPPKELSYIPEEGEVFEVTEERYEVLSKNNSYCAVFVEKVEEPKKVKEVKTTLKSIKKKKTK